MKKTILFNVLSLVVLTLTSYSAIASPTLAAWFGVIIAGITVFLNTAGSLSAATGFTHSIATTPATTASAAAGCSTH